MELILSAKNEKIKKVKKLHTRKGREEAACFLIEGEHLVEAAFESGAKIREIYVDNDYLIPNTWQLSNIKVYKVSAQVMSAIAETMTPQGICAVCEIPTIKNLNFAANGYYLLVDQIQDPGNLGTIIRTADCAGITGIILSNGTVDHYNGKVIRATQGSIFNIPIIKADIFATVNKLKKEQIPIYGTSLNKTAKIYTDIMPQKSFALIVGNEGSGITESLLTLTDENIYIPIYGKAESLNVTAATAILLYHLRG